MPKNNDHLKELIKFGLENSSVPVIKNPIVPNKAIKKPIAAELPIALLIE